MTDRSGWTRQRIKFVAKVNDAGLSETTDKEFAFDYVDIGRVTQGAIDPTPLETVFKDAPSRARRLAETGDTVVSTVRTYLRAVATVGQSELPQVFSTGFAVLHPKRSIVDPGFLSYYLQSDEFVDRIVANSVGVSYPAINASDLAALDLWLPDIHEQRSISDFLDRETAQIDAMIEAQHALIATLEERRAAVVLDATISRWTREAPARLSRFLSRLDRPIPEEGGVVTAYRDGEVTLRSNRRDDGYTFSETEAGYQGVMTGDIVFHALDGFAGAVGVSDSVGKCSPVYHVCRAAPGNDPVFLSHLLRGLGLSGFLTAYAWSVRQRSVDYRNWSLFGALPVRVPDLDGQQRAGATIIDSLAGIGTMISATSEAIVLMQERRSAMISTAVTGRMGPSMVREAVADKAGMSA